MRACVRACVCVSVCVCVSADMSPYCSAQDEWLIMKRCMYVGYHDANNVSNFGGDPVNQLIFLNVLKSNYRFTANGLSYCIRKNCGRVTAMERHARETT